MAAQSCMFSANENAEKEPDFLGTEPICLILRFDDE